MPGEGVLFASRIAAKRTTEHGAVEGQKMNKLGDLYKAAQRCTREEHPDNWEFRGRAHIAGQCACYKSVERTDHRVFCEWDAGAYVSSLDPNFSTHLQELVTQYGPPDLVEFRAHSEGWAE